MIFGRFCRFNDVLSNVYYMTLRTFSFHLKPINALDSNSTERKQLINSLTISFRRYIVTPG